MYVGLERHGDLCRAERAESQRPTTAKLLYELESDTGSLQGRLVGFDQVKSAATLESRVEPVPTGLKRPDAQLVRGRAGRMRGEGLHWQIISALLWSSLSPPLRIQRQVDITPVSPGMSSQK